MNEPADGTPLTDEEYERLVTEFSAELVDGRLDYLPMPRSLHSAIVRFLYRALDGYLVARHPRAALDTQHVRLRVRPRQARETDLMTLLEGTADPRHGPEEWAGVDLAIEVVSDDDPDRDYAEKRADYAEAGVREYWIVDCRERTAADPRGRTIRVLTLDGGEYRETMFEEGELARSSRLDGFAVDVTACLAGA